MQFTQIFKGFYESNGKRPKLKQEDIDKKVLPFDKVQGCNSYVGYLAPGYVLVDIDNKAEAGYDTNKSESKKLIEILSRLGMKTPILETTHGHHFFFKSSDISIVSNSGVPAPIGLFVDYKTGYKNGASCFKLEGVERTIVQDTNEVAELPIWLKFHGRLKKKLEELKDGTADNGRNNFLSSYKFLLLKNGYQEKEVYQILEIINDYMLYDPLDHKELGTIMRQEDIKPEFDFMSEESFLSISKNGNVSVDTALLAEKIIKENDLISIDKTLYGYNGKSYEVIKTDDINRKILDDYSKISNAKWKETRDKIKYLTKEKKLDERFLSLENGILNIETLEVLPHSKEIISVRYLPQHYDPNADTKPMKDYIMQLVNGDEPSFHIICEFIGYCFHSRNFMGKALIIKGDNSNGKSKFYQVLEHFFTKKNYSSLDLMDLEDKFRLSEIIGVMVNIGDDISGQHIKENSMIKKVITGDSLTLEKKGEQPFSWNGQVKAMFSCNEAPTFKDSTGAMKRRFIILPFPVKFSIENNNIDTRIMEKITTKENMEALLLLGIQGLRRLIENNHFTYSEIANTLLEEFDTDNNPIKAFINEEIGENMEEIRRNLEGRTTGEIYTQYSFWCISHGYKGMNNRNFGKQLKHYIQGLETKVKRIDSYSTKRVYTIE